MKKQKVVKVLIIVIAVALVAQSTIIGYFGIGPLKFIHTIRMGNLPGNKTEYDFSGILPLEESPLLGGNIAVLGSSVAKGEASQGYAVGEYLAARLGCTLQKEAVSGTTLVSGKNNSYVNRILNFDQNQKIDLFICQLSTNDATQNKPIGQISDSTNLQDFDTTTITGAMEYIICYAQETWECPVVFFTGSRYDSAEYEAMVERLLELQEKWGIGVLDIWNNDEFNEIPDETREVYMRDDIHPTKAGYRDWWGPEMERQLLEYLNG